MQGVVAVAGIEGCAAAWLTAQLAAHLAPFQHLLHAFLQFNESQRGAAGGPADGEVVSRNLTEVVAHPLARRRIGHHLGAEEPLQRRCGAPTLFT